MKMLPICGSRVCGGNVNEDLRTPTILPLHVHFFYEWASGGCKIYRHRHYCKKRKELKMQLKGIRVGAEENRGPCYKGATLHNPSSKASSTACFVRVGVE